MYLQRAVSHAELCQWTWEWYQWHLWIRQWWQHGDHHSVWCNSRNVLDHYHCGDHPHIVRLRPHSLLSLKLIPLAGLWLTLGISCWEVKPSGWKNCGCSPLSRQMRLPMSPQLFIRLISFSAIDIPSMVAESEWLKPRFQSKRLVYLARKFSPEMTEVYNSCRWIAWPPAVSKFRSCWKFSVFIYMCVYIYTYIHMIILSEAVNVTNNHTCILFSPLLRRE